MWPRICPAPRSPAKPSFDAYPDVSRKLRVRTETLAGILQRTIGTVRGLAYDLRPPGLDQLGLVRTVFLYCEDFSQGSGVEVDFFSAGMEDLVLDFDTEINLYRLIQEGLRNIQAHAHATRATVRLLASSPHNSSAHQGQRAGIRRGRAPRPVPAGKAEWGSRAWRSGFA